MEISEIKALLNQFDGSTLTEFDLKEGSFELYMNKNTTTRQVAETPVQSVQQPTPQETTVPTTQAPAASGAGSEQSQPTGQVITSPIVGIVYLQPSPEQEAYVSVGKEVAKGDTVCIIEAMKLLNEITSEYEGTITEILVENEEVVEYGQPLFRIS